MNMKELTIRALEANIAYKEEHNIPKKTIILEGNEQIQLTSDES